MNSSLFYPSLLVLHLIGLTLMAGTTVVNAVSLRSYWKLLNADKQQANAVLQLVTKLARPIGIGAALLIFTGLGLMILTHGAFGEQTWFRIKFALVIVLIANTLLFGRRQIGRLVKKVDILVHQADETESIRRNIAVFHSIQFLIFFVIIILSVFKFN
ncbi:hypothetical protein [Mucilaginibacter agri]|uniref:DUF2214 family protein n=1 Tax=Mucilaginibacter agri TaxID=2695265 RepID=A0A966DRI2_9SPHI|nr:hypothetical protein [Mucilaginibacter agri]NCD69113.1 hypothetical protein [Mucilaginibacter agri]